MEVSLEVIIWFIISFAIGSVIFGILVNFDYQNLQTKLSEIITEEDNNKDLESIEIKDIPLKLIEVWKKCGFGEIRIEEIFYVNETGNFNNQTITNKLKEYNLCHILGVRELGCGSNNELNFTKQISTPKIIKIYCNPLNKNIYID